MNDTELFELCKEVYERFSEWDDTESKWHKSYPAMGEFDESDVSYRTYTKNELNYVLLKAYRRYDEVCPLYTSDYLLEKLQAIPTKEPEIQDEPHIIVEHSGVVKPEYRWSAKAFNGDWLEVDSDTPLKALLKLVIVLDDAGVKL